MGVVNGAVAERHRWERVQYVQFPAVSLPGHYYKWQRALSQPAWLNKD